MISFPVPKNTWFTRLVEAENDDEFTLFSCCLAPGFHIDDFSAKSLKNLINKE